MDDSDFDREAPNLEYNVDGTLIPLLLLLLFYLYYLTI